MRNLHRVLAFTLVPCALAIGVFVLGGTAARADMVGARAFASLPARHEERDFLQAAERPGRLGELGLAGGGGFNRGCVRLWQVGESAGEGGCILEVDHEQTKPSGGVRTMK